MEEYLLETRQLGKCFGSGEREFWVLKDLNVTIPRGKLTILKGRSGSGKTTLMNQLGALDTPSTGDVLLEGRSILGMSDKEKTDLRRKKMGFVFQSVALMPMMTARENVELAAEICPNSLNADEVLRSVGLGDRLGNFPAQLSGGEQQRVSIARALAKNPKMILCDEPTGALDYNTGKAVLKLLQDTCRSTGKTVVIITHNSALTQIADRVIRIKNGQAVQTERCAYPVPVERIEW